MKKRSTGCAFVPEIPQRLKPHSFPSLLCRSIVSRRQHKGPTKMSNGGQDLVSRGVCPACLTPIPLKVIATKITQQFTCPHCHKPVETSPAFRTFVYIACFGFPTATVYCVDLSLIASVILWPVLVFACSIIYIQIVIRVCPPRLRGSQKGDDDFQTLDLGK